MLPVPGDRPSTIALTIALARIPKVGGLLPPRPPGRLRLPSSAKPDEPPLRQTLKRARARCAQRHRPRAPKARSPTGGDCPRNPRRASPSRPPGGPLPRHKSKNSGRSTPKPTTTAQSPAVLTPTGRFAALSGGQSPPAPQKLSLRLPCARWHRRPHGRGPDFCLEGFGKPEVASSSKAVFFETG